MTVPAWVKHAVFYQIFPDRFANGNPRNDPDNVQPWGTPPTRSGYQGGDLAGIIQKLDYLSDLGINGIYLNPIFLSPSNHRYHTSDYYRIDPILGSLKDFRALIEAAHQRGIRVILDGVFNHASRGFFAFNDIMENGADSPYVGWFHVRRFPLRAFEPGKARNYTAWWGLKPLPKFNTNHPAVRSYLLDVARYWIEQGADGWRLDVPNEIDDDAFWAKFREVVRSENPEAYLVGEIWEALPRWANDTHFDGLMNYPARAALLHYLTGQISSAQFAWQVERLLTLYPRENVYAQYNLLGSHDTERILTYFGGDLNKTRLAFLLQFAYPGVPSIYYGDEIGLEGGRDPDCRRAFPWDPANWKPGLHDWVKALVAVRKGSAALCDGDYRPLLTRDTPAAYAFARCLGEECVLAAFNACAEPAVLEVPVLSMNLPEGSVLHGLLDQREAIVQDGKIQVALEPFSGAYLRA